MDYTDFDTRLAAYAVVVDDERRILLALWNEEAVGRWTLPGGGVELEETVEQATVREVREETGYEVALGRIIGIDTAVVSPEERLRRTAGRSSHSASSSRRGSWAGRFATRSATRLTRRAGFRSPRFHPSPACRRRCRAEAARTTGVHR